MKNYLQYSSLPVLEINVHFQQCVSHGYWEKFCLARTFGHRNSLSWLLQTLLRTFWIDEWWLEGLWRLHTCSKRSLLIYLDWVGIWGLPKLETVIQIQNNSDTNKYKAVLRHICHNNHILAYMSTTSFLSKENPHSFTLAMANVSFVFILLCKAFCLF